MRPDAVPRHKHRFRTYIIDKDEHHKYKIVECQIKGCRLKFFRTVFIEKGGELIG